MRSVFSAAFLMMAFLSDGGRAADADVVSAARSLAQMWQDIPKDNYLVHACDEGTFSLVRVRSSSVKVDVKRTNSLISPLAIIAEFDMIIDDNKKKDFTRNIPGSQTIFSPDICYKSIAEAYSHVSPGDFSKFDGTPADSYHAIINYSIAGSDYEISMVSPSVPEALITNTMKSTINASVWGKLLEGHI